MIVFDVNLQSFDCRVAGVAPYDQRNRKRGLLSNCPFRKPFSSAKGASSDNIDGSVGVCAFGLARLAIGNGID